MPCIEHVWGNGIENKPEVSANGSLLDCSFAVSLPARQLQIIFPKTQQGSYFPLNSLASLCT